ncbi:uncharacterized protein LOC113507307 isoform X1 [Trichoplusia ni]|uniref:Uncharacterized protein LOC113507307 isoform X1 n=1 Tax=Trichoplusia ni TaxID=7111 RepID=A0A7E5WYN2_TRINI|nr:uncharacterized protein LOC113507307 isoform X1 [Trichoplusia ni]
MPPDKDGGPGAADIARWLPIITGAVVGAGVLTCIYLFKSESPEPVPIATPDKEEIEVPKRKTFVDMKAREDRFRTGPDGCVRIDLRKKRWLTPEEEQELQMLEEGMNDEQCEIHKQMLECEKKRRRTLCEYRQRQRLCQLRMQQRFQQTREQRQPVASEPGRCPDDCQQGDCDD